MYFHCYADDTQIYVNFSPHVMKYSEVHAIQCLEACIAEIKSLDDFKFSEIKWQENRIDLFWHSWTTKLRLPNTVCQLTEISFI